MIKKHKFDLILIASLLAVVIIMISLWFFIGRNKGKKAIVYHNDEIVAELDLAKHKKVTIDGDVSEITIEVSYGKVFVLESGCKNQICVNSGKKQYENETITCLPNKVYVIIVGGYYE